MIRNAVAATLCTLAAVTPAAATQFRLIYEGWLAAPDTLVGPGGTDLVTGDTPFRFVAEFDDTSPDLVDVLPFPGFVAYAPTSASITLAGQTFDMVSFADDPVYGIGISIFDPTNPIFPGFYGIGFIANPLADGAGIIGDFTGASTDFLVTDLQPTTFLGFRGAGFLAGIGCNPGNPGPCVPRPLDLIAADGARWLLGFEAPNANRDAPPFHSASLVAVPEPAAWALMIAGFGLVGTVSRRRRLVVSA